MTDMLYCYCCRTHHPRNQMRLFPTTRGKRWRCLRSIQAARDKPDVRDAFGRQQSEINHRATIAQAERMALFYAGSGRP